LQAPCEGGVRCSTQTRGLCQREKCTRHRSTFFTESILTGIGDIQEAVLVLVFLVDGAHERSGGWQDFIDEDEDGLFWRELDALADDVDKLADSEVCWNKILLLIDGRNI